jgi:hypothetical protein
MMGSRTVLHVVDVFDVTHDKPEFLCYLAPRIIKRMLARL